MISSHIITNSEQLYSLFIQNVINFSIFAHMRAPVLVSCHDPQRSGACQTYFPWPQTRCIDPGSILAEQHTMPDEATKVGMQNTDAHICAPSLFSSQRVYIYPTSTGNFPSLEIN